MGTSSTNVTAPEAPSRGTLPAVRRLRLEAMLDSVPAGGVGLVIAPAGSGKSVLLRQWMARLDTPACHVRATPAHDDAGVFARALTAAVGSIASDFDVGIADLVNASGSTIGDAFANRLLVELEGLAHHLVIVIDDAHHLTNATIGRDMSSMLERLPRNVRVVVGARWDTLFRLHRLRLDGRLVEMRATELAFDVGESRQLVESVANRPISTEQSRDLTARTDGWVTGLQLAAISLQRTADVDAFVREFTGSNQLVAEYLTAEVLDGLEPDLRRFLLHTSVLEWLGVELCDHVTGDTDAREMLDELSRRSLFIVHPRGAGERLRYHHLFADLLRYRLRVTEPGAERELRLRAADWLVCSGHLADGIDQLLAAKEPRRVLDLVVARGQELFEREEAATLVRWLTSARDLDPDLPAIVDVNLLATQVAAHDVGAAAESYRRLRRRRLSHGETAASCALYTCLGLDDLPTIEVRNSASEALDLLERFADELVIDFIGIGGRDSVECIAEFMTGMAWLLDGELERSATQFEMTLGLPGAQYRLWKPYVLGGLALVRALTGRCTEARSLATAAVDFAEANHFGSHHSLAIAHLALGRVALDQCRFDEITYHLHQSEIRVQRTGRSALIGLQRVLHIDRVALTRGPAAALEELRAAPHRTVEPQLVTDLTRVQEIRFLLAHRNAAGARALLNATGSPRFASSVIDVALASGDVETARRALDGWIVADGDVGSRIAALLSSVSVLAAEGRCERARLALQEAVSIGDTECLRRPFVEQPTAMRLLRSQAGRGSQAFASTIVDASAMTSVRDAAQDRLVEPLSERECEVLDYLPTRLSNKEVASALYISINTLKTHLSHIYTKLGAADRDSAVARATDLGLL